MQNIVWHYKTGQILFKLNRWIEVWRPKVRFWMKRGSNQTTKPRTGCPVTLDILATTPWHSCRPPWTFRPTTQDIFVPYPWHSDVGITLRNHVGSRSLHCSVLSSSRFLPWVCPYPCLSNKKGKETLQEGLVDRKNIKIRIDSVAQTFFRRQRKERIKEKNERE